MKFHRLFGSAKKCAVIGMVHVGAIPGTPRSDGSVEKIVTKACQEAEIYLKHSVGGILVENMHDIPYVQSKFFTPETTAVMTRVCTELRKIVPQNVALGVQVLACGNEEALAVAKACSMNFVRAEGFVFSHIGDEGFIDANAGQILRYRKSISADDILILADIKKKHSSHSITNDVSIMETAIAAEFFLADGVILTGTATGDPADQEELALLKKAVKIPVLVGSGVTAENVQKYKQADALIVGSYFKKKGVWHEDVDVQRVTKLMSALDC